MGTVLKRIFPALRRLCAIPHCLSTTCTTGFNMLLSESTAFLSSLLARQQFLYAVTWVFGVKLNLRPTDKIGNTNHCSDVVISAISTTMKM